MKDLEPKLIKHGIPRPVGYMDNPFIGDDGKDYHSPKALRAANQVHFARTHHFKSSVLGREYLPTLEGATQMRRDEVEYRAGQKNRRPKILEKIRVVK